MASISERLLSKCEPVTECGCWIWTGAVSKAKNGEYGVLNIDNKKHVYAHRLSAKHLGGLEIDGMVVRHVCDNPSCINPNHLTVGTQADNIRDRCARRRTATGERASRAKLTEAQVAEIRESRLSHRAIARIYGVSHSTVGGIKRGVYWKCLT